MIRKYFHKISGQDKENIKWRSHEPSRIEAFSDAVFAFAISLLIMSLEVPKSSKEMLEQMAGLFPFGLCLAFIFKIWYDQYKFFRRYGMHDKVTIYLNFVLIFVVLSFMYPLKFLFNYLILEGVFVVRDEDVIPLLVLYNSGFCAVSFIFAFMYANAFKNGDKLGLTPIESFETKTHFYKHLYMAIVATIAMLTTAFGGKYGPLGQACWVLMSGVGVLFLKRKKLFKKKFGDMPALEPQLGVE